MKNKKRNFEITNEISLAKLSGIEVAINQLDDLGLAVISAIPEKRGVVSACKVLASRVLDDCNWVNKNVDDLKMDPKEAKIRIKQIQRIANVITEVGKANSNDIISLQAEAAGHKKSADLLAKKYEEIAIKYEMHERVDKEDEEENFLANKMSSKKKKKINRKLNTDSLYVDKDKQFKSSKQKGTLVNNNGRNS
jgi:hypothetical protein